MAAWRFFNGPVGWKWQQLSADREVLAESRGTYATYEECIRDAARRGYAFLASQEHLHGTTKLYSRQPAAEEDGADASSPADEEAERG